MTPDSETAGRPKKPTGYSYLLGPHRMLCIENGKTQTISPMLWEAEEPTAAHDERRMMLTAEINGILKEVAAHPPERDLELSLIKFESRYMLAWTQPVRGITPHDDLDTIAAALHLRREP
jgi:hypothetical protein